MTLEKTSIQRVVSLGAFAVMAILAVAQTSSPALVITSKGKGSKDSALDIVDPVAKKVVNHVPVGGNPHDVAVSDDGKFAFVTNITAGAQWLNYPAIGVPKKPAAAEPFPQDTISVIDLAVGKELRRVDVGPGSEPHGIAFAGGKVYFTAEGYKLVGRYDPAMNRIDWMGGIGQNRVHQLVVTKDTKMIFTANIGSDTVAAIAPWDPNVDVQTYSQGHNAPPWNTLLIPVGRGPEGIAMSPDDKEVWTLTRGDGSVAIIDVATKKVSQILNLKTNDPLRITFTPDGSRVLIADGKSGDMLVLDAAARKEIKRIANVGKDVHGIVVAPDGGRAYAAAVGDDNIAIIDMKTLEVAGRIAIGSQSEGMAWAGKR